MQNPCSYKTDGRRVREGTSSHVSRESCDPEEGIPQRLARARPKFDSDTRALAAATADHRGLAQRRRGVAVVDDVLEDACRRVRRRESIVLAVGRAPAPTQWNGDLIRSFQSTGSGHVTVLCRPRENRKSAFRLLPLPRASAGYQESRSSSLLCRELRGGNADDDIHSKFELIWVCVDAESGRLVWRLQPFGFAERM